MEITSEVKEVKDSQMIRNLAMIHDELDYLKDDLGILLAKLDPIMMGKEVKISPECLKDADDNSTYQPSDLIRSLGQMFIKVSALRTVVKDITERVEC
jgi:hypothetical protein